MSDGSNTVSALPDGPLTRSAVKAIEGADSIRGTIVPTWKSGVGNVAASEDEHTDDIIVVFSERVKYLSRLPGEGWVVERDEAYADDEEFEIVMDEIHDYAVEYSREKMKAEFQ